MIERLYAAAERRILAFETMRRGRAHAAAAEAGPEAISRLSALPARAGDAEIVSFDVFDTLLARSLAPEAILRKTAGFARLIAGEAAGQAAWTARHDFARALKSRMLDEGRGDEPALAAILEAALRAAGIGEAEALAARLVAFETAVEAAGAVPDPEAAPVLAALAVDGRRLVAVSDMHLPEASIRALLARAGLAAPFERVFVSSGIGWTKKGGRLFPHVAAALGASPGAILHVGDRLDADVRPALAAGFRAVHLLDRPRLAAREAERLAESWVPAPGTRRARLRAAHDVADERDLGSAEALVDQLFGPAVGLFALAALGHAGRIGARRLFHLSRDATIAGEVAAAAAAAHPWLEADGLSIRELAISRAQGALLTLRREDDLAKLAHLLPYLAGAPPSAAAFRAAFGVEERFSPALEAAEGEAFLAGAAAEAGALLAALAPARARLEAYLEGRGLFDEGPAVALDIGYSGTFAAQLSALFMAEPERAGRIDFLFLFTSRNLDVNLRRVHPAIRLLPGVALDHRRRAGRRAARTFAWAEPFLVDPGRGRLEGYVGGEPVFAPAPLDDAARAARRALRERLRARALRFIAEFPGGPGDAEELAALLRRRLERFAARPTAAEERAVRALAHQTGQAALRTEEPTRRINPFRLRAELEALRLSDRWIAGSLRRSGLGLLNAILADPAEPDRRADPRAPDA